MNEKKAVPDYTHKFPFNKVNKSKSFILGIYVDQTF
jgi:hypothetical protein